jgi:hypothetical protein
MIYNTFLLQGCSCSSTKHRAYVHNPLTQYDHIYTQKTYLPSLRPQPFSQPTQLLRNLTRQHIMHRKQRMQSIQPKVLIHRHPTARVKRILRRRPIRIRRAVPRRIPDPRRRRIRRRVVEDRGEHRMGVEGGDRGVGVRGREVRGEVRRARVPVADGLRFERGRGAAVDRGARAAVHGRHVQEEEVARAGLVQGVDGGGVDGEDGGEERGVLCGVGVADVVDAEEEGEQAVGAGPAVRGVVLGGVDGLEFGGDLVAKGEHGGIVGRDEARVDGGAAVGQVVCFDEGLVVGDGEVVGPDGAVGGGIAWVCWVSERV